MTLKETKSELKRMAHEIREARKQLKIDQREGGGDQWAVYCMAREFRFLHIAYCLARGRTYDQIEPKVRDGNGPRWDKIEVIQKRIMDAEAARKIVNDPEVDHVPA